MGPTTEASARQPLQRDGIVDAAMALADEEGVGALSMRKLARRLGYEVMSLYNHVANKDELQFLMVDCVAAEIDGPPTQAAPLEAVRTIAVSTHNVLVAHPWAPELWQRHPPGPARTQIMEDLLRLLDDSGLSPDLAHHGFHAVNNHVLGYTLQELGMTFDDDDLESKARAFLAGIPVETYPFMVAHVHQHLDGDTASSFELVLDLILDGLVRLDANR
ncbi:MAG: TetR/AcrR family transcriptional regulator [Acidimicrobiales bacterium]